MRALILCLLLLSGIAQAVTVENGELMLPDGTLLHYTVTRPDAEGRYPTILMYDPYDAGVASDPRWVDDGYVYIGSIFGEPAVHRVCLNPCGQICGGRMGLTLLIGSPARFGPMAMSA